MTDYLDRPAPSRIMAWPGNEAQKLPEYKNKIDDMRTGEHMMKGLVLHFEDKDLDCKSLKVAAKAINMNVMSFRNCVNMGKIPRGKGLEAITYQGQLLTDVATGNRKPCYIITDKRYEFDSASEVARLYGRCESVVRKWILQGHSHTNNIKEIGWL